MKSGLCGVVPVLAGIALAAGLLAGSAFAESRNRALERIVSQGMFSADEGARMQRAFSSAVDAGIQQRDALSLVEACVSGEFDASQVLRMLSIATQLALEGLPVDGFISKIEEGAGKRVAAERIVQVAERRALMLNKAKLILNSLVLQGFSRSDRDELLPDLAEALEAGRSPEEARAILADAIESGASAGSIRQKLFP